MNYSILMKLEEKDNFDLMDFLKLDTENKNNEKQYPNGF